MSEDGNPLFHQDIGSVVGRLEAGVDSEDCGFFISVH